MAAAIPVAPDAVGAWIEYLAPRLDTPVKGERDAGTSFVRVRRAGGGGGTKITDNAQMVFECYGPFKDDAARLANHSRAHVFAAAGTRLTAEAFCKTVVNVSEPADMPDPDRPDLERYSFTVLTGLKTRMIDAAALRGTPAP